MCLRRRCISVHGRSLSSGSIESNSDFDIGLLDLFERYCEEFGIDVECVCETKCNVKPFMICLRERKQTAGIATHTKLFNYQFK